MVGDRHVAVGRREWVEQRCAAKGSAEGSWDAPHSSSSSSSSTSISSSPSSDTEVWVGWSGQGLAGQLLLSDALRPDAHAVVSSLRSRGLQVLLLSGDRREAVAAMAAAVGIDPANAYAEVRPEGKAALVQQLRGEGRKVAMVGDGVNDAPALASAHVGVAMGGGTAVAGDAAGVVLLGDRLGQVDEALALGRATLAKIRQNLAWAGGREAGAQGPSGARCVRLSRRLRRRECTALIWDMPLQAAVGAASHAPAALPALQWPTTLWGCPSPRARCCRRMGWRSAPPWQAA